MTAVSSAAWDRYISALGKVSRAASEKMAAYFRKEKDRKKLIAYAAGLSDSYGSAAAALASRFFEAAAAASGLTVEAELAAAASMTESASALGAVLKNSQNPDAVGAAVGKLVKRAGMDTIAKNAIKYKAEWAWIPHGGETCAFCIALASNGWQLASKQMLSGGHVEHVHANCDCGIAVRWSPDLRYRFYKPEVYKEQYDDAAGATSKEKINSIRRKYYAAHKDEIDAEHRRTYAERMTLKRESEKT